MRNRLLALGLVGSVALSGCATIFNGSHQKILVAANEKGATIKVDGKAVGKTPMQVPMLRKKNHTILIEKEGYKPFEYNIRQTRTGLFWLNYSTVLVGMTMTLTSQDNDIDTNDQMNYTPLVLGSIIGFGGMILDNTLGASNKFLDSKIQGHLIKIPEKAVPENTLPIVCENTVFTIKPGTKLGSVKVNDRHDSDITWEHTVNVTSEELTELANANLKELGYQVPQDGDNKSQLARSKSPKIYLVGTIEEVKYNVNSKTYESSRQVTGPNSAVVTISHDYKTECNLKVNWQLYNYRNKQLLYQETVEAKALKKGEEGGKVVVIDAYENALYTLLNNGKIKEHLFKKENQPEAQAQAPLVLAKPVSGKPDRKVNEYLSELVNSVVTLKTPYSHGSGFVISADGYLVTNYHVVEGFDSVQVLFDNGDSLQAKVVQLNEEKDLALLKMSGKTFKPLRLSEATDAAVGAEVYAIGTPTDISLGQTISRGIISGRRKIEDRLYLQTDVSINRGNSGGPLIDQQGNVIGVVNAKLMGQGIEGIGFAIPASEVLPALNVTYAAPAPGK